MRNTQYDTADTIVAVSSPTSQQAAIVRISGPQTTETLRRIFTSSTPLKTAGLTTGYITVDDGLEIQATLYLFAAPNSYTGDCLAEIHFYSNNSLTEALMTRLLSRDLRIAEPGEFTARAYLNGKMDMTQAEAVAEIVASSNKFQLAAAEKLLAGRLADTTSQITAQILDYLSLLEAGLDFTDQDIEFVSPEQGLEKMTQIKSQLQQLLAGSVTDESIIDLPAVGIAGTPNAGKSSLLNKLLGAERSIISENRKTTRDVLTAQLKLDHCDCVLFDCAGLIVEPSNILDELAQKAAVEALQNSSIVIFCVDISKSDFTEDIYIRELITPQILIPVATKADLLDGSALKKKLAQLKNLFGDGFSPVSVTADIAITELREKIDALLVELTVRSSPGSQDSIALTARHKQIVTNAINSIDQACEEVKAGNDEITAMILRSAYQSLTTIEQVSIDEKILTNIFSRFCIGK